MFPFYDNYNQNSISYYIKFKGNFSKKKFEILKRKNDLECILKLKSKKFLFYLNKWICIFNLKSEKYNYKKILELYFCRNNQLLSFRHFRVTRIDGKRGFGGENINLQDKKR